MTRVNVTRCPECKFARRHTVCGWFTRESAEVFEEDTRWNGTNHVGVMSGLPSEFGHEDLVRTAEGRWVRHYDAHRYHNGPEFHEFITDEEARDWLIKDENDEAVERYFGELEPERGPRPGRPEIGGRVTISLGVERLARLDGYAAAKGASRADTVRELLDTALDAVGAAALPRAEADR